MNENTIRFLQQQTCATICSVDESGKPYCFNCFYAFNSKNGLLYFKSSSDSYHSKMLKLNPWVAGTVLPDKLNILMTKGVQFEGLVLNEQDALSQNAPWFYHKKYPLAVSIKGDICTIQLNRIKMTAGMKGFRKKHVWYRDEQNGLQLL